MAEEAERNRILTYLEHRFGISRELFDDYLLLSRKDSWYMMRKSCGEIQLSHLKPSKVGLKAFHKVGNFIKPTTRMIQIYGPAATRAKLEIDESQLSALLSGGDIPFETDIEKGYVILTLKGNRVMGLGLLINGRVRSQLPRKEVREAMLDPEAIR
ncbi:MAG TPA: hypothetical protein PK874_12225 [Desulfobacteraceae bacterium]|nr:hypothetical protein [Desulfobacteraceae bacterium]HPJ66804.1 hypothetical protein [Desulfobacteraceae bacterium]HPQ27014.1 hypothetical protein [Desulfobacteraceae bacterium]